MNRRRSGRSYWPFLVAVGIFVVAVAVFSRLTHRGETPAEALAAMKVGCSQVRSSYLSHSTGNWVTVAAPVIELMPDAHGTSTHQRFLLKCPLKTVLVENNVDVGRRVPVTIDETVGVHGQYIWNHLGGLIHDTHQSTSPSTPDGWIYAAGRIYQ